MLLRCLYDLQWVNYKDHAMQHVNDNARLIRDLLGRTHTLVTYNNAFHVSTAVLRPSSLCLDTSYLADHAEFLSAARPVIDECAHDPPQLGLVDALFTATRFRRTLWAGQALGRITRPYPALDFAMSNLSEE